MRLNAEILEARWFSLDRLPGPFMPFTDVAIAAGLSLHRLTAPIGGSVMRETA